VGEAPVPDAIPMGMEIEKFADDLELGLYPWQRELLLKWFPEPVPNESRR
jgi:hypothetical protein